VRPIFSLFRPRDQPPEDEVPSDEPVPADEPTASAPEDALTEPLPANRAASPEQALAIMLQGLGAFLPEDDGGDGLPAPSVSVVRVRERAVGLGNRRGTERRGPFATVELKGGRLDAVVRFQVWGDDASAADEAIAALQGGILGARDPLWTAGYLRVSAVGTSQAEQGASPDAWRRSADYEVLYEFHYQDAGDAESIIARIPIHSDPEEGDSLLRETTTVTDEMVRWDDEGAAALEVAAPLGTAVSVNGLASLAYLPLGWTGAQVTLARLERGSAAPPTSYPTLAEFLAAVTDAEDPDRHAQVTFASVADLLGAFTSAGDPIELGDWDEDGTLDAYEPGSLAFDPPVRLERSRDLMRLSYGEAAFDAAAVVYLRVGARSL
jgi:hypothetical protein